MILYVLLLCSRSIGSTIGPTSSVQTPVPFSQSIIYCATIMHILTNNWVVKDIQKYRNYNPSKMLENGSHYRVSELIPCILDFSNTK